MSEALHVHQRGLTPAREALNAGFKVGLGSIASLFSSMIAGKVLAVFLGPAGVGLYGLLRQLLQNLALLGSFSGQAALVHGIASHPERVKQGRFAVSVLGVQVLLASLVTFSLILSAPWLGPWLIPHADAAALLRWLSLAMLVMVAQAYATGLLNGHRLITELVIAQIMGAVGILIVLLPVIWLIRKGHPFGYVLMLGGPGVGVTWVSARAVRRRGLLPLMKGLIVHLEDAKQFFSMSAVMLTTGLVAAGAQFLQSWLIAKRMGLAEAGQFWTAWTLSMSYVSLVLGSLGTYYLPSLSRLTEPEARRSLIRVYLRLALLTMPLLVSVVIVFKPWMIRAMFSDSLLPALKVMRWMLIGDLFKGMSWVLSFPMLAFSDMRWFFWSEVGFSLGMLIAAYSWLALGGDIEGLGILFMVLYVCYLPTTMLYIHFKHGLRFQGSESLVFVLGLSLVILLSAFTWKDEGVRLGAVAGLALLGGGFALIVPESRMFLRRLYSRKRAI